MMGPLNRIQQQKETRLQHPMRRLFVRQCLLGVGVDEVGTQLPNLSACRLYAHQTRAGWKSGWKGATQVKWNSTEGRQHCKPLYSNLMVLGLTVVF